VDHPARFGLCSDGFYRQARQRIGPVLLRPGTPRQVGRRRDRVRRRALLHGPRRGFDVTFWRRRASACCSASATRACGPRSPRHTNGSGGGVRLSQAISRRRAERRQRRRDCLRRRTDLRLVPGSHEPRRRSAAPHARPRRQSGPWTSRTMVMCESCWNEPAPDFTSARTSAA
jgi:hypothetical protein